MVEPTRLNLNLVRAAGPTSSTFFTVLPYATHSSFFVIRLFNVFGSVTSAFHGAIARKDRVFQSQGRYWSIKGPGQLSPVN